MYLTLFSRTPLLHRCLLGSLLALIFPLTVCSQTPESNYGASEILVRLDTPAKNHSALPELIKDPAGHVFLTWVEDGTDDNSALLMSDFTGGAWTDAREIASGSNWFVNWADFPTLAADGDNLAASFLERSSDGAYTYDVKITTSGDAGATWGTPFSPHTDGTLSEHGFVSLLSWNFGNQPGFAAVWLDGRNTASQSGQHGSGAMTLRSTFFDLRGNRLQETELDVKTCDCCQTAAVRMGPAEMLVAYRDRSDEEIRDIATVRFIDGTWREPGIAHADGWQIAGCPVNGPALDNLDDRVALAWFTAAGDRPRVKLSISTDRGNTFGQPIVISEETPLGRVGVAFLDARTALVTWLEKTDAAGAIHAQAVQIDEDNALKKTRRFLIEETSPTRRSGFPRMVAGEDFVIFAWTEVLEDNRTHIQSAYAPKERFID